MIVLNKKQLLNDLKILSKIVPKKASRPLLTRIRLVLNEDGLKLYGTDLDVRYTASIVPAIRQGNEQIDILVDFKPFFDLVKSIKKNEVDISFNEENITVNEVSLVSYLSSEYPDFYTRTGLKPINHCIDVKEFLKLKNTVCNDETRLAMNGVYFDFKNKCFVTTCDRTFTKLSNRLGENDLDGVIVPLKIFDTIGLLDGHLEIYIDTALNETILEVGQNTLVLKNIQREYPRYENLLPTKSKGFISFNMVELENILKMLKATNQINKKVQIVKIHKTLDKLFLNEVEVKNYSNTSDFSIEIGLNLHYFIDLVDTVKLTGVSDLRLEFNGELLPVFTHNSNYFSLVMPIKL